LIAVGRLRPRATLASAQAEMDVLSRRIALAHPTTNHDWTAKVETIQEAQFGSWKADLYPLWGTVIFVLLISCANVANLFLGRLAARAREISVRAALGATRRRLIVQLLSEGLLIGLTSGALGLLLAGWGIRLFVVLAPSYFPLLHSIQLSTIVLLFCLGISIISGVLLAIVPAFVGTMVDLNAALKLAGRSTLSGQHGWLRSMFATIQIALSVALLAGAGLMTKSFLRVLHVDPGFRTQQVVTMQIFLSGPRYFVWRPDGVRIQDEVGNFYSRLLERIRSLPGVQSVALVSLLPEMGYNTGSREHAFRITGRTEDGAEWPVAGYNAISEDYFKTLQIPLLKGRHFRRDDSQAAPWVAIVNREFEQRYWPNESAIDGGPGERPREVVGVVAGVPQDALEKKSDPEIFVPYLQQQQIASGHGYQNRVHMNIVVRTLTEPGLTIAAIRKIAAQMDNKQPVYGVRTMAAVLADAMSLRRLHTTLMEVFAGFALFLSTMGITVSCRGTSVKEQPRSGCAWPWGQPRQEFISCSCYKVSN
jgi:putative ABC transport system permease protein